MTPLVSIITPSYNQANFLKFTIQSVIQQGYPELEYLIVDGGSKDNSVQIIKNYSNRLSWWVSESDSGQAEAINKGFRRATGEIIAWLNSDDLYLPGAIHQAVTALENDSQLGLVFGNAVSIDAKGGLLNPLSFGDWGLNELLRFRIICQPAVFMRRSVLEEAGYLDLNYHYMLDHHLWLRIARLAPIKHIHCLMAAARQHPSAKNVSQAPGFGKEALLLLDWMKNNPEFAPLITRDQRRVEGGAYRLNARYLLDGNQPGPALHSYWKAFYRYPGYTLRHGHRILYAMISMLGLKKLADFTLRLRPGRKPDLTSLPGIEGWPGL